MQSNFEQIKLNIPKQEKEVIEYCRQLSTQRQLSATIIRLLTEEIKEQQKQPFFVRFKRKKGKGK